MKKVFKILIVIYAIVAIFTTISLFTYNKYNISEIGNKRITIHDIHPKNFKKDVVPIIV